MGCSGYKMDSFKTVVKCLCILCVMSMCFVCVKNIICSIFISNNMTRGKLAIKFPDAEGRFVNLPEASGNLIANFPTSHVISL